MDCELGGVVWKVRGEQLTEDEHVGSASRTADWSGNSQVGDGEGNESGRETHDD